MKIHSVCESVVKVTAKEVSTAHTSRDQAEVVSARDHDGSGRQASASCMLEASHTLRHVVEVHVKVHADPMTHRLVDHLDHL